jgi:hypothetical protein
LISAKKNFDKKSNKNDCFMTMKNRIWLLSIFHFVFVLSTAARAGTDDRTYVTFSYTLDDQLESCPDKQSVMQSVSSKLGYSPWKDTAPMQISVAMEPAGKGVEAMIVITGSDGEIIGERQIKSETDDCMELSESINTAIAIFIDPMSSALPVQEAPAPSEPPADSKPVEEPTAAPPLPETETATTNEPEEGFAPSSPKRNWHLQASIGGHLAWRATPSIAGGVDFDGKIRWKRASIGIGVRMDMPSTMNTNPGKIKTSQVLGLLSGCVHYWYVHGCTILAAGALIAIAEELDDAQNRQAPSVWGGARLGGEIPIGADVLILPYTDFFVPILRSAMVETATGDIFWETPSFHMAFGIAIGMNFIQ